MAVLFRSVRTSAPPLVARLQGRRIPFTCGGRTGLFLQPEVALLAQVHAWFVDGDWQDERFGEARKVELSGLVAGLEATFNEGAPIPELARYLEDWRKDRLSNKGPVSLVGDLYKVLRFLGVDRIDLDTALGSARLGALARFSQALADFEHVTRRGRWVEEAGKRVFRGGRNRGKEYAVSLYHYLLHYARDAYEEFEGEAAADEDAVDILTVHQSKGLEWPIVFIPALVEGRFPSRRAGQPQKWVLPEDVFPPETRQRYEGSEAEERRLYLRGPHPRPGLRLPVLLRAEDQRVQALPLPPGGRWRSRSPRSYPCPSRPRRATGRHLPSLRSVSASLTCRSMTTAATGTAWPPSSASSRSWPSSWATAEPSTTSCATWPRSPRLPGSRQEGPSWWRSSRRSCISPSPTPARWSTCTSAARRLVERYLTDYADDLKRLWAVERPFELHLEHGTLSGRADVILGGKSGGRRQPEHRRLQDGHRCRAERNSTDSNSPSTPAPGVARGWT